MESPHHTSSQQTPHTSIRTIFSPNNFFSSLGNTLPSRGTSLDHAAASTPGIVTVFNFQFRGCKYPRIRSAPRRNASSPSPSSRITSAHYITSPRFPHLLQQTPHCPRFFLRRAARRLPRGSVRKRHPQPLKHLRPREFFHKSPPRRRLRSHKPRPVKPRLRHCR